MNVIEAFQVSILTVFVVLNSAIVVLLFVRAFARIIAEHLHDRL